MSATERDPFRAKPPIAREWINLLRDSNYVLRCSDGDPDGTFRFWMEHGQLYWRCLNWGSPQQASETDLSAVLESDVTTQVLIE